MSFLLFGCLDTADVFRGMFGNHEHAFAMQDVQTHNVLDG